MVSYGTIIHECGKQSLCFIKIGGRMMDCGSYPCICQTCKENEEYGSTCTHCFDCYCGDKSDYSIAECYVGLETDK